MDRCIYCDVNVKRYTILCQVTWPTEVSRRQLRACLFIRWKSDKLNFDRQILLKTLLRKNDTVILILSQNKGEAH